MSVCGRHLRGPIKTFWFGENMIFQWARWFVKHQSGDVRVLLECLSPAPTDRARVPPEITQASAPQASLPTALQYTCTDIKTQIHTLGNWNHLAPSIQTIHMCIRWQYIPSVKHLILSWFLLQVLILRKFIYTWSSDGMDKINPQATWLTN